MRKAIQLIAVLLVVAMLAVPVCAATGSATQSGAPSATQPGAPSATQPGAPSASQSGAPSASQAGAPAAASDCKIAVTALVDIDSASAEIKTAMEAANAALFDGDLTKVAALAENNPEKLAVSELFYVACDVCEADAEHTITFNAAGVKAGQFLMVMVFVDGEWVAVDAEKVVVEDGKVTVTLEKLGPVAFVVEKA